MCRDEPAVETTAEPVMVETSAILPEFFDSERQDFERQQLPVAAREEAHFQLTNDLGLAGSTPGPVGMIWRASQLSSSLRLREVARVLTTTHIGKAARTAPIGLLPLPIPASGVG